jgi:hypothetical protein
MPLVDAAGVDRGTTRDVAEWARFYAAAFFGGADYAALTLDQVRAWGHGAVLGPGSPWVDERTEAGLVPATVDGIMVEKKGFSAQGKVSGKKIHSYVVDRMAEAVFLVLFYRALFQNHNM